MATTMQCWLVVTLFWCAVVFIVCSSNLLWMLWICFTMSCCVIFAHSNQQLLCRALLLHFQSHTFWLIYSTWCKVAIITTLIACMLLKILAPPTQNVLAHPSTGLIIFVNVISIRSNTCYTSTVSENVKMISARADAATWVRTGSCHCSVMSHWFSTVLQWTTVVFQPSVALINRQMMDDWRCWGWGLCCTVIGLWWTVGSVGPLVLSVYVLMGFCYTDFAPSAPEIPIFGGNELYRRCQGKARWCIIEFLLC